MKTLEECWIEIDEGMDRAIEMNGSWSRVWIEEPSSMVEEEGIKENQKKQRWISLIQDRFRWEERRKNTLEYTKKYMYDI